MLTFCFHSYGEPYQRYVDAQIDVEDKTFTKERVYDREGRLIGGAGAQYAETILDETERRYREGTRPIVAEYDRRFEERDTISRVSGPTRDIKKTTEVDIEKTSRITVDPPRPREEIRLEKTSRFTVDPPRSREEIRVEKTTRESTVDGVRRSDMGYYDDEGQYHSIRRGLQRAADRIIHPRRSYEEIDREEVIVKEREVDVHSHHHPHVEVEREHIHHEGHHRSMYPNTITIPCHHIRIGDLLILQGRPCQVIRITTSSQTGQHRYLGVDLFTKQLHEESSFISNPSPSVIVQNMRGPVFKQYRVLDIRDDGRVVAMTETGDIKQGLRVLDQSNLLDRLSDSFDHGRGSVRVLVINDGGHELAVDYKVVHGSRL